MRRAHLLAVVTIALAIVPGCNKKDGHIKVYPVQGKVLVRGAPAEGARVVLYPISDDLRKLGMPIPEGTTNAQGVFRLKSYTADDGAPAGEFRASVIWLEPLPPGADPDKVSPKDKLAERYVDPQRSQLTAKVEQGGGEIPPFELQ